MLQNPQGDQENLKAELKLHFAEDTDPQHALMLFFRKVPQSPWESIQIFAERLLALAEGAFPGYLS